MITEIILGPALAAFNTYIGMGMDLITGLFGLLGGE